MGNTFTLGELFSGPGGIAVGAHAAARTTGTELVHLWANDYDRDTVRTYIKNIDGATEDTVRFGDVRELDIGALPSPSGFAFGFPCNDYSLVGESKGLSGEFGPLYKYGAQVLEVHKPDWFVAENVSGLRSSNDGRDFAQILQELRDAGDGYDVVPHLYRFEQYGVPQRRHRIIIVGIKRSIGVRFRVPKPTHPNKDQWKSAREALLDIPPHLPNQEITRQSANVVERLTFIQPGKNAFNSPHIPDRLRLNVKGATLSQIYRRLDPNAPSYTITGSGGGGTHGYHWAEPRALTNRERARIQTFPDSFEFVGPKESVRRQVGMAVPPDGAEKIFTALFLALQGRPFESVKRNLDDEGRPIKG